MLGHNEGKLEMITLLSKKALKPPENLKNIQYQSPSAHRKAFETRKRQLAARGSSSGCNAALEPRSVKNFEE